MSVSESNWDNPSLIAVTGCESFYGSHVVYQLLMRGMGVRGTVWHYNEEVKLFLSKFPNASTQLTVVEADLLVASDWPPVMEGVEVLIHCAAPVEIDALHGPKEKTDKEFFHNCHLIGTKHVLTAALASPSVRRVCHTSSLAAVSYGFPQSRYRYDNRHIFTEEDFSIFPLDSHNSFAQYARGKTEAERLAWKLVMNRDGDIGGLPSPDNLAHLLANEAAVCAAKNPPVKPQSRPEIVVICPGVMMGPMFSKTQSPCIQFILECCLLGGGFHPKLRNSRLASLLGLNSFMFDSRGPFLDVRDGARMMVCAALMPKKDVSGHRFIANSETIGLFGDLIDHLPLIRFLVELIHRV
eukprot:GHVN01079332.1.p1 GENE.GHVN01079332.1~~GHVN01079332.1.p1  ORF type:complete len:353 (-),score=59.73 GHVN01079332.1:1330-2388(-)